MQRSFYDISGTQLHLQEGQRNQSAISQEELLTLATDLMRSTSKMYQLIHDANVAVTQAIVHNEMAYSVLREMFRKQANDPLSLLSMEMIPKYGHQKNAMILIFDVCEDNKISPVQQIELINFHIKQKLGSDAFVEFYRYRPYQDRVICLVCSDKGTFLRLHGALDNLNSHIKNRHDNPICFSMAYVDELPIFHVIHELIAVHEENSLKNHSINLQKSLVFPYNLFD